MTGDRRDAVPTRSRHAEPERERFRGPLFVRTAVTVRVLILATAEQVGASHPLSRGA